MLNRKWFRVSYAYGFQNSSLNDWLVLRASSDVRRCNRPRLPLAESASLNMTFSPPRSVFMLLRQLIGYREAFLLGPLT
jgi:hypothetical protein